METPASPSAGTQPAALALRLAGTVLAPLRDLIAARLLRTRFAPIILPLWKYLLRAERRFTRLVDLFAAGRLPAPRPGHSAGRAGAPLPFSTTEPWLLETLKHEAACYRNRLERLLAEPGMPEFLAASPAAARLLRPICRMLALAPPSPAPRPAVAAPTPASALAAPVIAPPATPPAPRRLPPPCWCLVGRWPWSAEPAENPA